jgi:hypothetical protein
VLKEQCLCVSTIIAPLLRAGYSMTARGRQRAAAKHTASPRGSSPNSVQPEQQQEQQQPVIADRVQQQLDALGPDHVGYGHKALAGTNISVVGGRPFSKVSRPGGQPCVWVRQKGTQAPALQQGGAASADLLCGCAGVVQGGQDFSSIADFMSRFGVTSMDDSAHKILSVVNKQVMTENREEIRTTHNRLFSHASTACATAFCSCCTCLCAHPHPPGLTPACCPSSAGPIRQCAGAAGPQRPCWARCCTSQHLWL